MSVRPYNNIMAKKILVVDDEERMVRFIRMNLEHDGFQVSEAFNGKQAIQKLRDVNPDLQFFLVSALNGDGMGEWYEFVRGLARGEVQIR